MLVPDLIQDGFGVPFIPFFMNRDLSRSHLINLNLGFAFQGIVFFESLIQIVNRLLDKLLVELFGLLQILVLPLQDVLEHGTAGRL